MSNARTRKKSTASKKQATASRKSTAARKPGTRKAPPPPARKLPVGWIAAGVVAIALVVAIVLSVGGGGSDEDAVEQFGSPAVSGELPRFQAGAADTAAGLTIPTATGASFDGTPVSIAPGGNAKAIVFLAHWCGHCQNEVPAVQEWLDGGGLPAGVDLVAVATGTDRQAPNYPPSEWLAREGWTSPVLVDDRDSSVANAFGLPGFPFWVFTDDAGAVVARWSGELPTDALESFVTAISG